MTDAAIISDLIAREGGYVDNPDDRGGPTNMGITLATLASWRGRICTAAEVQSLTVDEAAQIYEKRYIQDPGFGQIVNDKLRVLLIDTGVNSGPDQAVKMLQRGLGLTQDGILGPLTLSVLQKCPDVLQRMATERLMYDISASTKPSQGGFLRGWVDRVVRLI